MKRSVFKKTVFNNGMTLLTERNEGYASLCMGVWVKAGTRHETSSEAGVSHFIEHMMFKGTKKRSALDIAKEVDRVGGEFNAFTSREHTCFHVLLLNKDCQLGIEILTDILLNSSFTAEEIERERKVILQEIAMVDEAPEELAHDLFFERVYCGHPLGRSILGSKKSILALKKADLVQYFFRHYRPDQLVFSIAGDVDHDEVLKKLKPLAKMKWPGRGTGCASLASHEAPSTQNGVWWEKRPTEQAHLIWGMPGPAYADEDRFATFLLNAHLGGGMSSSLFQEIREKKGLAYTVYSTLLPNTDSGLFSVYVATAPDKVGECLKLIEKCVSDVTQKRLRKSELDWVKDHLKGSLLLSSDDAESRMTSIAKNDMFLGKYFPAEKLCKKIDEVGADELQKAARRLFSAPRSVLVLGPKAGPKRI